MEQKYKWMIGEMEIEIEQYKQEIDDQQRYRVEQNDENRMIERLIEEKSELERKMREEKERVKEYVMRIKE